MPRYERAAPFDSQHRAALLSARSELYSRFGPRFARPEPRACAWRYVDGLLGADVRSNARQLAWHAGERRDDGRQRLLTTATWAENLVCGDLRDFITNNLTSPYIATFVETGFSKTGSSSAAVHRQYSPGARCLENCQIGLFLVYSTDRSAMAVDRELYLPRAWEQDEKRRLQAGIAPDIRYREKPDILASMARRSIARRSRPEWVVRLQRQSGSSDALRATLEEFRLPYIVSAAWEEVFTMCQAPSSTLAHRLASVRPPRSAARRPSFARIPLRPWTGDGFARWLLVALSSSSPAGNKYYLCLAPAQTTLDELISVIGWSYAGRECCDNAKREVGLDHYEVRSWRGWHRHVTLAMAAHAISQIGRRNCESASPECD
jgi:SRSO17 transposase